MNRTVWVLPELNWTQTIGSVQLITSPIYRTRSYTEGSTKKKGNAKRAGIGRDGTWPQVAPLFMCGYIHLFILQNDDERGLRLCLEPLVCFFSFHFFLYSTNVFTFNRRLFWNSTTTPTGGEGGVDAENKKGGGRRQWGLETRLHLEPQVYFLFFLFFSLLKTF